MNYTFLRLPYTYQNVCILLHNACLITWFLHKSYWLEIVTTFLFRHIEHSPGWCWRFKTCSAHSCKEVQAQKTQDMCKFGFACFRVIVLKQYHFHLWLVLCFLNSHGKEASMLTLNRADKNDEKFTGQTLFYERFCPCEVLYRTKHVFLPTLSTVHDPGG